MDVGTGKIPVPKSQNSKLKTQSHNSNVKTDGVKKGDGHWIVDNVYIHLYDVVEPDRKFSVARFKDAATREVESMWRRQKVPFLVGGTGFYIAAVLGETEFPRIAPDWKLRRELEKLSTEELFEKLQKLDSERAKAIDSKNPRRLIRAIEIAAAGSPTAASSNPSGLDDSTRRVFPAAVLLGGIGRVLKIGLTAPREVLYQRADAWAEGIVNNGLLDEVQDLVHRGYRDTPPMKGIIYQTAIDHLDGKITKEEMTQKIKFDLHGYIRRQLTWFRRDREIKWHDITKSGFDLEVGNVVESYLK